ncbi:MAG: glycoside hydrolase family 3 N-terminal domain-containing protein [Bacteroidales bacterium]
MGDKFLKTFLLTILIVFFGHSPTGEQDLMAAFDKVFPERAPFVGQGEDWVDSLLQTLDLEEKIGQMIMVQAYSNQGALHERNLDRMVRRNHIGGVAFFQGDPLSQARITNQLQESSDVPLLVAIDGENGLGMRLEGCIVYPDQMILGAIANEALIYNLGQDMARQMKRLGVHMNLGPVADVNRNPDNPVIHTRSFGENAGDVAFKTVALIRGMQDEGVLTVAKHFPGHGDTGTDSHRDLPLISGDRARLDSIELLPFQSAIFAGITGVMTGHLSVPALDARTDRPATFSDSIILDLLRNEMGFTGLVVTDALNMGAVSQEFEPGEREVEAVKAGNDILLMPSDVPEAIAAIKRAVRKGEISEERIDASCRRILEAKHWSGAWRRDRIETRDLLAELNRPSYMTHYRRLAEASLTLVRNRNNTLPLKDLDHTHLATVTVSNDGMAGNGATADLYVPGTHFTIASTASRAEFDALRRTLSEFNTLVVQIWNTRDRASRQYGINDEVVRFVENLEGPGRMILNLAGYPFVLNRFGNLDRMDAILLSYRDDSLFQDKAMQGLFGGIALEGRASVSGGRYVQAGEGLSPGSPVRLSYGDPLDVGLDPDTLLQMERIIREAIGEKAIPGCQLLVARKGRVVWHKAYGYHGYRGRREVRLDDIYDLASVTKISSTLPALMRLHDQGLFHEDSLLGSYGVVPDHSNKTGLLVREILTHQSGLVAWIPFYYETIEPLDTSQRLISNRWSYSHPLRLGRGAYANGNVKFADSLYQWNYEPDYTVRVADHMYLRNDYRDTMYRRIFDSELLSHEYRYSDLSFLLMQLVAEKLSDTLLYPYVQEAFYGPLGATTTGFLPLDRFPRERIVPTENDLFFRRQLLQGHVHDPGAAMLGGVAGHAGLFSNANDLAKLMQMYLNGGTYGGERFIREETLAEYTACQYCEEGNRRGLGFDRSVPEEDSGPACDSASPSSYGHTGFTGTMVWMDPECDLLFVFLSNRVHPDQSNGKLIDHNVRTRIQQVIYDALVSVP